MINKSKFLLPAFLMSTAFGLTVVQFQANEKEIDLSAFKNLASNVSEIVNLKSGKLQEASADNKITFNIIKTIDKEISRKISINRKQNKKLAIKKIQHIDQPVIHIAESTVEINNSPLIELYGINSENTSYKKFNHTNNEVTDEVKIAASAPALAEESGPIEPQAAVDTTESFTAESDMPMFEYSKAKQANPYDRALSPTVKEAISRVVGKMPAKPIEKKENIESEVTDENDQIIYDYSKKPVLRKKKSNSNSEALVADRQFLRNYQISAYGVKIESELQRPIITFDFSPDYNREVRTDSDSKGIALLSNNLVEGVNTQTGTIEAQGMMSTRVELDLSTHDNMSVPMISEEEAEKLYPGKNLLLLKLDSSIIDTEIDTSFTDKIYFNENFKKVSTHTEAHFVMYAGIRNGNILLKYYLDNKETAQKVIYIGEKEMYFEQASFVNGEREQYSFTTRNLMSANKTNLTIAQELVLVFNTGIASKKQTLNSYELKMPAMVAGSRKYIEMKHLSDSIFVGTDVKFDIDVPSNEFIARVLESNQVSSLKDHCVVQINVSKSLSGFTVNGKNHSGEMYTETTFLDEDGKFSKTDFEQAEKAFIVGDMEGIFNVKLEYSDESSQYLKTFCSEGTYVVEQL